MLADIELAQTLQADSEKEEKIEEVPHALDRNYQLLKCQLQLLDPEAPDYKVGPQPATLLPPWPLSLCLKSLQRSVAQRESRGATTCLLPLSHPVSALTQVIHTYLKQTGHRHRCPTLQHVWKVNREGEVRKANRSCLLCHPLVP